MHHYNVANLRIGVLNLIFLLTEYSHFDKLIASIYFLVTYFNTVKCSNNLDIL